MANSARNQPGAENITTSVEEPEINPLDTVQDLYEKNKKMISTAVTAVVLVVGGFFGYMFLIKAPKDKKAAESMAMPQLFFQVDSMNLALTGDGKNSGFPKIETKYTGTDAGNLAHYYSGIAYLKTGDFKNAIKSLKEFDGKGTILENQALGSLGIAYMESGEKDKAIECFKKATDGDKDILTTPLYLYQMALAYEAKGNTNEAKTIYIKIRDEYPRSIQARDMDKELARLGVLD